MSQGASSKKKYTYVWVSAIILLFGIFTVVEVTKRVKDNTVVDTNRMMVGESAMDDLAYILNDGKKKRAPDFAFMNQDSVLVTNED